MSTAATPANTSRRLAKVPPFPPVAARLLALLARESVDLQRIAELISSDPTFCARLLQFANSARFAFVSPINTVQHALAVLGLGLTREITATLAASTYAGSVLSAAELRSCWRHMLATAVIADELAHALKSNIETAYTAGLLHDIGRLGLCVAYPREYERAIDTAQKSGIDLLDLEREMFGIDHTEAGRYLANRWALPDEFCIIAGRHHDACDGSELSLLRIVHTACSLADVLGYHVAPPSRTLAVSDVLADLPPAAQQRVTLSAQELRARVEQRMYISEFERDEHAEEARVVIRRHHMMAGPEDDFTLELPEPPAEQPTQQAISNRSRWTIATVVLTLLACVCWLILVVMQNR